MSERMNKLMYEWYLFVFVIIIVVIIILGTLKLFKVGLISPSLLCYRRIK